MRLAFSVFALLLLFLSCGRERAEVSDAVRAIPVTVTVHRFDRQFAGAEAADLPRLKQEFPYLFPRQFPDSVWLAKMNDTLQQEVLQQIDSVFPTFGVEEMQLELLFKHIKHYYPSFQEPEVVTLPSEVDYRNRVIFADSLLLIGLDNYLGADHRFYEGIARYIADGLDKAYLAADVAEAFAVKTVAPPRDRSFLSGLVYHGKLLYLKEKLLPLEPDTVLIGYSEEDLNWAAANEEQIWRYFIERELLYSTDSDLAPRFLNPAPFSKFRLELDNESPGRIGRYIGWQIVRAYMNKNEVTLNRMLHTPAEELFRKSGYKPNR